MARDEFNLLHGSSGLVEECVVTITDAVFNKNPDRINDKGQSQTVLTCTLVPDEDSGEDPVDDKRFSIGFGWNVKDRGARVEREDARKAGFNSNTPAQKLLTSIFECEGGEKKLRDRWKETGLLMSDAGFWNGMTGYIESREAAMERDGEKSTWNYLIFSEFHGWDEAKGAKVADEDEDEVEAPKPARKAAAKKRAAKKAAAAPEPEVEVEVEEVAESAMVTQLRTIAGECDDHDEFMDRAYEEVEGLDDDEDVMGLVDDPDGLFAQVNG